MKKNKLIHKLFVVLSLSVVAVSCGDDGSEKASAGFAGIASSYYEGDGDETITIPFVNGSVSASDLTFGGSATEGEDYQIVGVTEEGVQIKFLEDSDWEFLEKLRIEIKGGGNGNSIHTISLFSDNCNDADGQVFTGMEGVYTVVTDDWEDFHPGDKVTVEIVDDTHLRIKEYPATAVAHAGMVFTSSNFTSGTGDLVVPTQASGQYTTAANTSTTTSGTGVVTGPCSMEFNLTFVLPCCGTNPNLTLVLEKE